MAAGWSRAGQSSGRPRAGRGMQQPAAWWTGRWAAGRWVDRVASCRPRPAPVKIVLYLVDRPRRTMVSHRLPRGRYRLAVYIPCPHWALMALDHRQLARVPEKHSHLQLTIISRGQQWTTALRGPAAPVSPHAGSGWTFLKAKASGVEGWRAACVEPAINDEYQVQFCY